MNVLQLDYFAARMCEASYEDGATRMQNFFQHHECIRGYDHGTVIFVGETPLFNVVVFRGSEIFDLRDIATNLKCSLKKVKNNPYGLHHGVFDAWREVAQQVAEATMTLHAEQTMADMEYPDEQQARKPWLFTGHSMGGQLATIAAASQSPAHLVTFGAPRVGNAEFVAKCVLDGPVEWRRWVNGGDFAVSIPPRLFGYADGGEEYYINSKGEIERNPYRWARRRDRFRQIGECIEDHSVTAYVDELDRLLAEYADVLD